MQPCIRRFPSQGETYPMKFLMFLFGLRRTWLRMFARRPLNELTVRTIGPDAHGIANVIEPNGVIEVLREREEHIRLLLNSTAEAIYGIDLQGCCTFANSTCARLLWTCTP
jgi:PAS domain-containing protein